MKINKKEKSLIKTKSGLFNMIRNYFKKFFFNSIASDENKNILSENEDNRFTKSIQIKQDEEELRILQLQQEFKKGNIEEEAISEEDYSMLIRLYDEQNAKLQQEIEKYRIETAKIIKQMKNN